MSSTASEPARHRVVVVGGGFGGLQAVRKLNGAAVDVTLVDRQNFHLFQPLAYQVATGALSAAEVRRGWGWQARLRSWLATACASTSAGSILAEHACCSSRPPTAS